MRNEKLLKGKQILIAHEIILSEKIIFISGNLIFPNEDSSYR